MTTRERVVEIARDCVGSTDRAGFWVKALGYDPGKSKHWCGAFWLACIKEAGLTNIKWGIDGTGVQALKLRTVRRPEPGDLGYIDDLNQHHFLVEAVGEKTYSSIDGNSGKPNGVYRHNRALKTSGVLFYSIASLLGDADTRDTDPAPPLRATLRIGSSGDDVKALQAKLNSHGASLKVDGGFGPFTKLAVETFQRRGGLVVDGIVGSATWRLLEAV
jgi:hypothetical protein